MTATLQPLGDRAILVRFGDSLSEGANREAIAFAARLEEDCPEGVEEITPGLVSVLVRTAIDADFGRLSGELRLRTATAKLPGAATRQSVAVHFDGEDLSEVAGLLQLSVAAFVARHNAAVVRVLATGFAPGFVYCGFHAANMVVPRREAIRLMVPAGTVLFAAGQTAIAATPIRTGWHVIGQTGFQNFDPGRDPPTGLTAGDEIVFTEAT